MMNETRMTLRHVIRIGACVALALGSVIAVPASADQPPIDLASLGTGGFRINGAMDYEKAGVSVAGAGDVNGDGWADLVIGAYLAGNNGRSRSGSAYVVFGGTALTSIDLADLGSHGFRIDGAAGQDYAGGSVAGAGDVNGDGKADLLIGATQADNNSRPYSGSSYVVFGKSSTTTIDLDTLGTGGFRIDGAADYDQIGFSVDGAGDVNSDGKADLLIGAPYATADTRTRCGSTYVVFGKASTADVDLASLGTMGFRIDGAAAQDQSGYSVAGVGDVNADGTTDLLIGADMADNNSRDASGSSYVVFGKSSTTTIDLATLGAEGFRIDGAAAGQVSGWSVAGAEDVNADGRADLLIGAREADYNGRTNSGSSYVVFGKSSTTTIDLATLGAGGFRIDGAAAGDETGYSVAGAGDVNADGTPDLLIGARFGGYNGRHDSGSAYVVFGKASPTSIDLATLGAGGFRIDGAAAGDETGYSVAGAGDVNADGGVDILLGAPEAGSNSRPGSGSGYVVFGTRPSPATSPSPSPPTTTTPAATLLVNARKAGNAIPATAKATLVKKVTVGPGQKSAITVKVKPKRTKKTVKVTTTATKVKVRTRKAPKGKVTVKITSSGAGYTPVTWTRTWKVR